MIASAAKKIVALIFSKKMFILYCLAFGSSISASPSRAADYYLIPQSMIYFTGERKNEYIALLFNNRNFTISRCKVTYRLINDILTSDSCSAPAPLPSNFLPTATLDLFSTIAFTRSAKPSKDAVFGPDGVWRLDQSNGRVEFCVFGDIAPKCVILNIQ